MTTNKTVAPATSSRSLPGWAKTALDIVLGVSLIAGLGSAFGYYSLWSDSWILGLLYPVVAAVVALIGVHFTVKVGEAHKRWGKIIGYGTVVIEILLTLGVLALTQRDNFEILDFWYGALCASILIVGVILVRAYRWLTRKYN